MNNNNNISNHEPQHHNRHLYTDAHQRSVTASATAVAVMATPPRTHEATNPSRTEFPMGARPFASKPYHRPYEESSSLGVVVEAVAAPARTVMALPTTANPPPTKVPVTPQPDRSQKTLQREQHSPFASSTFPACPVSYGSTPSVDDAYGRGVDSMDIWYHRCSPIVSGSGSHTTPTLPGTKVRTPCGVCGVFGRARHMPC